MAKLLIYCLLQLVFFLYVVSTINTSFEDQKGQGRITGGNRTIIQDYPYMAFLRLYDGRAFERCGGSIISTQFILTAAHCLLGVERAFIRIGSTFTDEGGQEYQSSNFRLHPLYRMGDMIDERFDTGVINVMEGMSLDGIMARAVPLAMMGNDPQMGVHVTITGWGLTNENDTDFPRELRVAQTHVVDRRQCNSQSGGGLGRTQFCAGATVGEGDLDEDDNPDVCKGDYGGPAVDMFSGDQIGIASYGRGCGQINSPSVYIRIGSPMIRMAIMAGTGV